MISSHFWLFIAAYGLGSIPTGYWLGLAWKGIDIRQHGSGNVGSTNVLRVLGPVPGAFTFTIDFFKGLVPVLASHHLFPGDLTIAIVSGLAAILGHVTSIFVWFKGGKGVATSAGVFAALLPLPFFIGISVFAIVTLATRYVSLGSLVGALTLVGSSFIFSSPRPLAWATVLATVMMFWTHRANIQRLLQGTENHIEWHKKKI